jgi:hypothetical protein
VSNTNDIRAALEQALDAIVGFPATDQIAFENINFRPSKGTSWARVALQITDTGKAAVGPNAKRLYEGLMLVDVFNPRGNGPSAADAMADLVVDTFTETSVHTSGAATVRIRSSRRALAQSHETDFYMVPCTVTWYCYLS